jgi:hypothetical protein
VLCPKLNVDGDVLLTKIDSGNVLANIKVDSSNTTGFYISFTESYKSSSSSQVSLLTQSAKEHFTPSQLRTKCGNQLVGNAFTTCKMLGDNYIAELGIRDGEHRVRVRFHYSPSALAQALIASEHTAAYSHGLVGLTIIREQKGINGDISYDPALGQGIYDPQAEGEPYVMLPLPGRLSLLFPRALRSGDKFVLTMEIVGQQMRYQLDRVCNSVDESLLTLELTEVRLEDSKVYPPPFLPRHDFLQ